MATNELVTWATGLGANVLTSAEYGALQERQQGVQAGIANPQSFNKAVRQGSFTSAMVGQFTADYSAQDVLDDGDVATYEENFIQAILNLVNTPIYGVDNGTANHVIMPRTFPTVTHVRFGTIVYAQVSTANTGASDIKLGSFGPFNIIRSTGAALKAGDLIAGGIAHMFFDGWQFQLLNWQDPGGVGSGGTTAVPPPAPPSNLQLAGRLPVYGSGRWIYVRFAGTLSGSTWTGNDPVEIKIPPDVTSIRVRAGGAGGGGAADANPTVYTVRGGGGGEFAYGTFAVSPGQTYIARLGAPGIRGIHSRAFPNVLATSGGDTTFELSGGSVILSVRGGNSGDLGGAGGTGGSGGSFRAAGGSGSELGGGGGAGSQIGQGGAGGLGGGGVGPSGYGGPLGGGGSLWGPGDGSGPGKGGIDWTGAVGGKAAYKDGVSPAYCMDFFPGGGGSSDGSTFPTAPSSEPSLPTVVITGNGGGIGGGGGSATGFPADWTTQPSASNGGYANGGDGGCGGGGGSGLSALGVESPTWSADTIFFRRDPYTGGSQMAGGGNGGVGGGGGGGKPAGGYGGPGWLLVEW